MHMCRALVVLVAAVFPAGARAATFGSDLSGTPASGCVIPPSQYLCTLTQLDATATSAAVTAPISGVLTAIKLKHGAEPAGAGNTVGFRILTPTATAHQFTARIVRSATGDSGSQILSPGAGIDTYSFMDGSGRPNGVPITAGEQLAVYMDSPSWAVVADGAGAGEVPNDNHNQFNGAMTYQSRPGELLLQGTVEPDADHDGFGDETQEAGGDGTTSPTTSGTKPDTPKKRHKPSRHKPSRHKPSLKRLIGLFSTYVPGAVWEGGSYIWFSTGAQGKAVQIRANHRWRWHGRSGRWARTGDADYPLVLRHAVDGHDWKVGTSDGAWGCAAHGVVLWDNYTWYCGKRVTKH